MKEETLLEKAKNIAMFRSGKSPLNEEELDLVLAWFNDEVTTKQASQVLGKKGMNYASYVSTLLKRAYLSGKLEIKKVNGVRL